MNRHRVVVIGSGFGGLTATKALEHVPVDVTMIARTQHHLFQPLLYQVATGILSEGEIAPPTRRLLRNQRNAEVLLGNVVEINLAGRYVVSELLGERHRIEYDNLIVAAGAGQSYFGNDHFAEFAPGMKTLDDALEVRARILGAFEAAEQCTDAIVRERLLTFTVVGAGPTGVELAGQIAELANRTLKGEFRHIDSSQARVILLDAASAVLPAMGTELGQKAQQRLEKLGVEIELDASVIDVDRDGLTVKYSHGATRRIGSACKVWSAGVAASPLAALLAEQAGAEVDRSGRLKVLPDLTVLGHPNVFVIGDMAAVPGVPGMAQGAIQGAKYAARAIRSELKGKCPPLREPFHCVERTPFRYFDKGSMATVSRFSAVAKVGRWEFGGFPAWLAWLLLHLIYLVGFRNKVMTAISWSATFLTMNRGQLTFTGRQARLQRPTEGGQPDSAAHAA
ncbi:MULTISPECIES: NAD(P)/FAD-dependent oxidoreductase [unclassified Mycolicibacterium]|uniref:NAD(P)/FAD-dependent oxidoreductase n=1 Tax=unclassified Mycolicibacterium TaxID=2636767 RepID=UPI002EDB0B98